jgi:serine protease
VVPDVYLRDNLGDSGVVPVIGGISASPDIIVRPTTVANPNAAFGQGSGTENSSTLGYEAEAGQDNYIYVRMKNRGGANANNVTATVYWSEVSTLVTPDMWNLIGTTPVVNVPQGDTLVVADPITWSSADIPATGHYCFVGMIDHPGDPAPPLPAATDWAGFTDFIRNQNNVTWRNFNVVNVEPDAADTIALPFQIAGAPDRARIFGLEIMQHIPRDIKVWLELPLMIAKPFLYGQNLEYKFDRKKGLVKLRLPARPSMKVPRIKLGKSARIKARLLIEGNKKQQVQPGHRVAIRQLYDDMEVGRVTWQFHNRKTQKCEV